MDGRGTGFSSSNEISGQVTGTVVQVSRVNQAHFLGGNPTHVGPPRQLPEITALFTGRQESLDWLDQEWQQAAADRVGALFVITGTAGVGKSSLAIAWLRARSEDFPDGQLYADLAGYSRTQEFDSGEVLDWFLRSLGVAPDQVPTRATEKATLLRTVTHNRRICVLLDNALSAAQVRILGVIAPGCATFVTTRGSMSGLRMDGARFHQLDPWPIGTGVAFLRRALGEDRVREESDATQRVVELCGSLPLALRVAAEVLAARPRRTITRLAAALAREDGRQELLEAGEGSPIRAALDGSYRALNDDQALLYRALGHLPTPWFEPRMVAAMMNSEIREAGEQIDALAEAHLLEVFDGRNGRYRFHDFVRTHAAHCANQAPARGGNEALCRLLDFYLASATLAEEKVTPSHRILVRDYYHEPVACMDFSSETQAVEWLDLHRQNLMALLRYCAARKMHRIVQQLADAMWPLFLRQRYTDDRREALTMAVMAARARGDKTAEGSLLLTLASVLSFHEEHTRATEHCDRAQEMYRQLGDLRGLAQAYNTRAKIHARQGKWDEAEALHHAALEIRERIGHRRGVALTYQGLGKVAAGRGELDLADEYLRRSHIGLEAERDWYDAAWSQALRAQVVADLGDTDRALGLLDEAFSRMRSTGSDFGRAGLLEIYGRIHQALGNETEAKEHYQEAGGLFAASDPVAARRISLRLAGSLDPTEVSAASKWQL